MEEYNKSKYKKISISLATTFILILIFPILSIKLGNIYANPQNKYRAEGASSTAHTIIIDDHYRVETTSANESKLVYIENPESNSWDEIYSYSVDKLNWTDEYILVGAKSLSTKKYSYMILDRETGEKEGYANKKEFKKGKEEKGIDVEVKNKKYFDWY